MTIDDIREEIGRRIVELVRRRVDVASQDEWIDPLLIDAEIKALEDLERWITPDVTTTPLDPKPLGGVA